MTQLDPPGPAASFMSSLAPAAATNHPPRPGTIPGSENPHPAFCPFPFNHCCGRNCGRADCCGCCAACHNSFDRCCMNHCPSDVIVCWNFVCFACPWLPCFA